MELDIGKMWVQTLREAEERGEIPELSEWDAETMSVFLGEHGYSIEDLDNAAVAGQLGEYSRKRQRRHWFRWLRLRRKMVRLSDLAAESYGEPGAGATMRCSIEKNQISDDDWEELDPDGDPVWDEHFKIQDKIQKARRRHDYKAALRFCSQDLALLDRLVKACVKENGSFDIWVDSIGTALEIYAIRDNEGSLEALKGRVSSNPHLSEYQDTVNDAYLTLKNTRGIVQIVADNPGIKQNQLKKHVLGADGRKLATLSRKLEQHGRLMREKVGKTYALTIPD